MTQVPLGSVEITADPVATRGFYAKSPPLDPACCNACATLQLALNEGKLSPILLAVLAQLGVDASKPVEAWGAPDGGFLQVWWPFVGFLQKQSAETLDIDQGQTVRITSDYPHPDWTPSADADVPAVEFTWTGDAVRELERRAWAPANDRALAPNKRLEPSRRLIKE